MSVKEKIAEIKTKIAENEKELETNRNDTRLQSRLIMFRDELKGLEYEFKKQYAKYKIEFDGYYSSIVKLADGLKIIPNDCDYFHTFTAAKKYLIKDLRGRAYDYTQAAKYIQSLKKSEVEEEQLW
jgi:hypothetical protein